MSELGLAFDVSYQTPWHISKECDAICKIYKYPSLIDGCALFEGKSSIIEYLRARYLKNDFWSSDAKARYVEYQLYDWIEDNILSVCKEIINERVHKSFVHNARIDTIILNGLIDKLHVNLKTMMVFIEKNGGYIASDVMSFVDIFAAAFVSTVDYFGYIQWKLLDDLKMWYVRIKSRKNFYNLYNDALKGLPSAKSYRLLDF